MTDSMKIFTGARLLPKSFSPSINEIIIGRGKKVMNHVGNENFRELIHSKIHEYEAAENKTAKSTIIFQVLQQIKRASPETGGFVKKDPKSKRWYAVEDSAGRTTTAQAFRDALSAVYRSSKQYKQQRRWRRKTGDEEEEDEEPMPQIETKVQAYQAVAPISAAPCATSSVSNANGNVMGRLMLGDILDSALEIVDDMMPFMPEPVQTQSQHNSGLLFNNSNLMGMTSDPFMSSFSNAAPAPSSSSNFDFDTVWNTLGGAQGTVTDDPFEPTPLAPAAGNNQSSSASPFKSSFSFSMMSKATTMEKELDLSNFSWDCAPASAASSNNFSLRQMLSSSTH